MPIVEPILVWCLWLLCHFYCNSGIFNFKISKIENNSVKSRVGFYISKDINYVRRTDLEGLNSHVIIIDITGESKLRVITNGGLNFAL